MKIKMAMILTAVFVGGLWSGYFYHFVQSSLFRHNPCWLTLVDVSQEARYQEELGRDGWDYENPKLKAKCVLIDEDHAWKGYRKK